MAGVDLVHRLEVPEVGEEDRRLDDVLQARSGRLVKNRARDVTVKVRDSVTLNAVQGASVRAYGAGVSITTKTTNSSGVAKFHLKPTQLAKVTFRVSKTGYVTVYLQRSVSRP